MKRAEAEEIHRLRSSPSSVAGGKQLVKHQAEGKLTVRERIGTVLVPRDRGLAGARSRPGGASIMRLVPTRTRLVTPAEYARRSREKVS